MPGQLELRPAELVERLFVEARFVAVIDHAAVGHLGVVVVLVQEQHLAATKLCLVDERRLRIPLDEIVQDPQRVLGFASHLVGPRQLIENRVVAAIVRVLVQQRVKQTNRVVIGFEFDRAGVSGQLFGLGGFELEVGETAHGFGLQFRIV